MRLNEYFIRYEINGRERNIIVVDFSGKQALQDFKITHGKAKVLSINKV